MNRLGSSALFLCGTTALIFAGLPPSLPEKSGADRFGPQLSKAYTALFNDLDLVHKGKFGLARDPFIDTHLREDNEPLFLTQMRVQSLLDTVKGAGLELEEGLFAPLSRQSPRGLEPPETSGPNSEKRGRQAYFTTWIPADATKHKGLLFPPKYSLQGRGSEELEAFAADTFGRAKKTPHISERAGYRLYSFPVRYEHKECISCHPTAKLHDTAAVLTFAFKKA